MSRCLQITSLLFLLVLLSASEGYGTQEPQMTIDSEAWGSLSTGKQVTLFTLKNANGMEARILDYGGIIVSLTAPDRSGHYADVVLGFDTLAEYESHNPFFGAITGRYANRIAAGKFTLEGKEYQLAVNNGPNHLHGGLRGFDKQIWTAEAKKQSGSVSLVLTYISADGEEGYPGQLTCKVTYTLTAENALEIAYEAVTDKTTVLNLTNHTFFNLSGKENTNILDHQLHIQASRYLPTDKFMIPTGSMDSVEKTPLDFTTPHLIGERIEEDFTALQYGLGYDHTYILDDPAELKLAARASHPGSGRVLTVYTSEPGVQFYSGNHLRTTGKKGRKYQPRDGFCLETQHYPDSPNQPTFPSTVLKPGETFHSQTVFKFTVDPKTP